MSSVSARNGFKWWHSLRLHLLLTLLLAMVGFYLWIEHNVASVLADVAYEHAKSSIRLTSEALNLAITPHTTLVGLRNLNDYFHELLGGNASGLLYLALYDEKGMILASAGLSAYDPVAASLPLATQIQQGVVHVTQPILVLNHHVGELKYGLSLLDFDQSIKHIHQDNLWVLFFAVLLVGLILLLSFARLNRRFSRLINVSQAFAQGDYHARVQVMRQDELSLLARHFNRMADMIASRMEALKDSQAEVELLNAQLEARVAERTQALSQTLQTLEDAQQHLIQSEKLASLGALVAGVSHELNTPIGNAFTVVTTLSEKNQHMQQRLQEGGLRKSELTAYVNTVDEAILLAHRNLHKAADLIQSFKQVAIDQTSYQRRRFNLLLTVEEVLLTIQPMLRQLPVRIHTQIDADIQMVSYPGPLGQIITNLINNAITHAFTAQSSSPQIQIDATISGDHQECVTLMVSDNGQGIVGDNLKKIFDPFFTTRLGQGGSGLGLHIVHNLVTGIMGGRIMVDSTLGQGTCFTMRFPLNAPEIVATPIATAGVL